AVTSHLGQVTAGFMFFLIAIFLCSLRWQMLMHIHSLRLPTFAFLKLFMIGNFFAQFMPGGIATGDIIKSYYVTKRVHEKRVEAVTLIFLDRVIGTYALVWMIIIALTLNLSIGTYRTKLWVLIIIGVGSVVLTTLFFSKRVLRRLPFFDQVYDHLPYKETLTRIYNSVHHYKDHKRYLFGALLISLTVQLCLVMQGYYIGNALGLNAALNEYLLKIPIVNAVAAIPITFGSFGTAEAAYMSLFASAGAIDIVAHNARLVAFMFMMRLVLLFWGAVEVLY
ncbi:unnamed protein product, partial [marine sediment metagenome]